MIPPCRGWDDETGSVEPPLPEINAGIAEETQQNSHGG
jgi:hypothetical protein